ncbi:hypothetical protein [Pelagimonas phthalicica]|nr:hypothetical protein [Pelagimonas phthalicica]
MVERLFDVSAVNLAMAILAVLVVGVAVVDRLWRWARAKQNKSEIAGWQAELLRHKDAPDFFQYVAAYLAKVDPQGCAPEFAPLLRKCRAVVTVDVAFNGEGLDWFVFHGSAAEIEEAAEVVAELGLDPLVPILREVLPWFGWSEANPQASEFDHPDRQEYMARLSALQQRFAALGGADLVSATLNDAVRDRLPDILAYRP